LKFSIGCLKPETNPIYPILPMRDRNYLPLLHLEIWFSNFCNRLYLQSRTQRVVVLPDPFRRMGAWSRSFAPMLIETWSQINTTLGLNICKAVRKTVKLKT